MANYSTKAQTGGTKQIPIIRVEDVEITVVDERGEPAKAWYYSLVDADGTEHEGQLDDSGKAKVEEIRKGGCQVRVSPSPFDAAPAGAPPPPPPCPEVKRAAGDGPTARRRRGGKPAGGDAPG